MRCAHTVLLALLLVASCKGDTAPPSPPAAPVAVAPPGTLHIVLDVDGDVDAALEVARRRVDALRDADLVPLGQAPEVRRVGERGIVIDLPLAAGAPCESDEAARWVETTTRTVSRSGRLGFHREAPPEESAVSLVRATGVPGSERAVRASDASVTINRAPDTLAAIVEALPQDPDRIVLWERPSPDSGQLLWCRREPEITGADLKEAKITYDERSSPSVALEFTPEGGERFATLSGELIDTHLAIVFEGVLVSAPLVRERIAGGRALITMGQGSPAELVRDTRELAAVLNAGSFSGTVRVGSSALRCE